MSTRVVQQSRLHRLNDEDVAAGDYVLYWMQQSQRAECNHALEHAVRRANALSLPLVVGFGLTDRYPEASYRHYRFMLEGLAETGRTLERRGIPLVVRKGEPPEVALELAAQSSAVVCDRGYLRHQRKWRTRVAREAGREVVEVEADAVVPVEVASDKAEYGGRTIRPRILRHLEEYLVELAPTPLERRDPPALEGLATGDPDHLLASLEIDRSVPGVSGLFNGGTAQARMRLRRFVRNGLPTYDDLRSQPHLDRVSRMSPYLHFGQISPLYVALRVQDSAAPRQARTAYLEQLIVRRELALNFVHFNPRYDAFEGLPRWARETLRDHAGDEREHVYTRRELEGSSTHDPYWNAAMREMRWTGYMHNTMRMYWGKKILEWTATPGRAYRLALELNNRWLLDGRDPCSYANVGWLFGLHDRPWPAREIYGTVRSMSAAGLERKTDPDAYVSRVERLVKKLGRRQDRPG